GLFFQTTRSLSLPYFSLSCEIVASTREQKGHWKSLKITSVTGAVREPHTGSLDDTGTAASSSLHAPPLSATAAPIDSPPLWLDSRLLPSTPYISIPPAKKQSRKPTMAVPLFMYPSSLCGARGEHEERLRRPGAPRRCDGHDARRGNLRCASSGG